MERYNDCNPAPYAVTEANSHQRSFATAKHPYRDDFQRDRDRIIHSQAFRRLEGKTQVFMPGVNDNYRNRLTHSIEVAQIGRTIAKVLRVNETLTEAICLAHDIGHSPFGHAGEAVLNELMSEYGGFEHNRQALRIVDLIEHPYPDFAGLNLMFETRLGLALHSSPYDKPGGDRGAEYEEFADFAGFMNCSLEGQAADVADRIAYNCHDLEDGMRGGLISEAMLAESGVELFALAQQWVGAERIGDSFIRNTRTAKAIIDILVSDCIRASEEKIRASGVSSPADVYCIGERLICLSEQAERMLCELERFLLENMYQSEQVGRVCGDIERWLSGLFERLCEEPELMPRYFRGFIASQGLQRAVCDYIAGMTDRFCLAMYRRLVEGAE